MLEAAEIFGVVVFFCDGLLQQVAAVNDLAPTLRNWKRFLDIGKRLPMEIQMLLCRRLAGLRGDLIPLASREEAFKYTARTF